VPSKPPEFLSIPIIKGITGFGFTIADSAHGQKVKKILDHDRCKNLMEGDILVNINDVNVRNMCHPEVVQVRFYISILANFKVLRVLLIYTEPGNTLFKIFKIFKHLIII
jgi:hypothetical protein